MNIQRGVAPADASRPEVQRTRAAQTIRLLQSRGLSITEAGNITAYLAGIRPSASGWSQPEIERLMFARWLFNDGRLKS